MSDHFGRIGGSLIASFCGTSRIPVWCDRIQTPSAAERPRLVYELAPPRCLGSVNLPHNGIARDLGATMRRCVEPVPAVDRGSANNTNHPEEGHSMEAKWQDRHQVKNKTSQPRATSPSGPEKHRSGAVWIWPSTTLGIFPGNRRRGLETHFHCTTVCTIDPRRKNKWKNFPNNARFRINRNATMTKTIHPRLASLLRHENARWTKRDREPKSIGLRKRMIIRCRGSSRLIPWMSGRAAMPLQHPTQWNEPLRSMSADPGT